MNTKRRKQNTERLSKRVKNIAVSEMLTTNDSRWQMLRDMIFQFFALNERLNVFFPAEDCNSIVEYSDDNGIIFVEEFLFSDFVKNRFDSDRFVDWVISAHLKGKLFGVLRKIEKS